ncbi:ROK family transcriptional regulator [Paludibacter sp.]
MYQRLFKEISSGTKSSSLKKEILCYYINNGETTLADLGKEMDLSVPTVTKLIAELIEEGFVVDFGKQDTTGGRKPNIYGLNQDSGYFLGVDINYSTISIGLINFNGLMIHSKLNIPYRVDHSVAKFDELYLIIENFINHTKLDRNKILNIGINIPGRVNTKTGHSYSYFYIDERPITEILKEKIGINVTIDNDSRSMTYGEFLSGCVKGEKNIVYVNVSWGLGMGLIIDGKLYYGKSGFSGEFGHYPTFDNDKLCHCGKKGCLETETSGRYIYDKFMEKLGNGNTSILSETFKSKGDISLDEIVQAALKDDMLAIELIEEVGSTLGKNLAGIINIFNPELVVIGGVLSQSGDYLFLPLKSAIKKYSLNMVSNDSILKLSKLGAKAGVIGACLLARSKSIGLL